MRLGVGDDAALLDQKVVDLLTPHEGELGRLLGRPADEVGQRQAGRVVGLGGVEDLVSRQVRLGREPQHLGAVALTIGECGAAAEREWRFLRTGGRRVTGTAGGHR